MAVYERTRGKHLLMRMKTSIKIETTEKKTLLLFHFSRIHLHAEHQTSVKEQGNRCFLGSEPDFQIGGSMSQWSLIFIVLAAQKFSLGKGINKNSLTYLPSYFHKIYTKYYRDCKMFLPN